MQINSLTGKLRHRGMEQHNLAYRCNLQHLLIHVYLPLSHCNFFDIFFILHRLIGSCKNCSLDLERCQMAHDTLGCLHVVFRGNLHGKHIFILLF